MIKRLIPYILCAVCVPVCFGGLADDPETIDGRLTAGEYVSSVQLESSEQLIIEGGGAFQIEALDYSYLEVQYTSTPLSYSSGIYDIVLSDNSELLYLDGITEEISIGKDAKAHLKGGRVDYITLYDHPSYSHEVVIYCREGYQMSQSGISGLWEDGSSFDIEFIDVGAPYPQTWEGIDVEIVPEPATLALLSLGLGGLLIRRKK